MLLVELATWWLEINTGDCFDFGLRVLQCLAAGQECE